LIAKKRITSSLQFVYTIKRTYDDKAIDWSLVFQQIVNDSIYNQEDGSMLWFHIPLLLVGLVSDDRSLILFKDDWSTIEFFIQDVDVHRNLDRLGMKYKMRFEN